MKKDDVFPSKYLKASDIVGREIPATIDHVVFESITNNNGREEQKAVMYCKGATKGIVLNMTNWEVLEAVYGDESDNWDGSKIILFTAKTKNPQGKTVDGIRIRIPSAMAQQKAVAPPPEPVALDKSEDPSADMDDDIPF